MLARRLGVWATLKLRLAALSVCLAAIVAAFVVNPERPHDESSRVVAGPGAGSSAASGTGAAAGAELYPGAAGADPVARRFAGASAAGAPAPQAPGLPASQAVISPDGQALVITGLRADDDRHVVTLYLVADGQPPRDLLPGSQAVRGTSTTKFLTGWIDTDTFAYEEHVGTGARELFLLDTRTWEPIATERLAATYFRWSPDRQYVGGQWEGGPPLFWVWDRATDTMLRLPPLPGDYQCIEDWSLDSRHLLFSAWTGAWPADEATEVRYYVLDVEDLEVRPAGEPVGYAD